MAAVSPVLRVCVCARVYVLYVRTMKRAHRIGTLVTSFCFFSTPLLVTQMFAERIVVKAMVKCLVGDGAPPAPLGTKARAVLHEGLV